MEDGVRPAIFARMAGLAAAAQGSSWQLVLQLSGGTVVREER